MKFRFHSNYADIEVDDARVFSFFASNAQMKQLHLDDEVRILVNVPKIIYELESKPTLRTSEWTAYSICMTADRMEVHYLIIEYTGEEDIMPVLKLLGWND